MYFIYTTMIIISVSHLAAMTSNFRCEEVVGITMAYSGRLLKILTFDMNPHLVVLCCIKL